MSKEKTKYDFTAMGQAKKDDLERMEIRRPSGAGNNTGNDKSGYQEINLTTALFIKRSQEFIMP